MQEELGSTPEEIGVDNSEESAINGPNSTSGTHALEQEKSKELEKEFPYSGIIVFGHGLSDRSFGLSMESKLRVTAAYQLWKDGVAPLIILTGGKPPEAERDKYGDDISSMAERMRKMLVERYNVPEENIIFENQSIKTVDNVAHAINALEQRHLPTDDFVTISSGYHMKRIADIMERFGLHNAPVSAEHALKIRAEEHARKMGERDEKRGLDEAEVNRRYEMRAYRFDQVFASLEANNPIWQAELRDEPKWREAMANWGYWGPLALAVRGDKLKEIVESNRDEIQPWLERHPDVGLSIEDIAAGNFDYMELVKQGREVPQ